MRALIERVVVGPAGADIRLRLDGLGGLVRDLTAIAPRAEGGGVTKTLLAPRIVEAILDGRQPEGAGLPQLLEPVPAEWVAQRSAFDAGWTSAS